jgi:membrane protein
MAFAAFVASSGRYSAIYSSFAVLILFLIWLYVGWLIVLAGAQVAYYHQHPSAYLLHLRAKQQTPLFREYLTLALLAHITRRFLSGKPPLQEEHLARMQGVPLTVVGSLMNDLVTANMLVRTDDPKGVMLARPPGKIAIVDVLKVVQHQLHNGPQGFTVGHDNIGDILLRRDAAIQSVLGGVTLRHILEEPLDVKPEESGVEHTSSWESYANESDTADQDTVPQPESVSLETPPEFPVARKWRSP